MTKKQGPKLKLLLTLRTTYLLLVSTLENDNCMAAISQADPIAVSQSQPPPPPPPPQCRVYAAALGSI